MYLKIISIPYFREDTNTPIILDVVKEIIKKNHTFNNIILVSRPCIIKFSPKSDIAIIWIDIWDVQSSNKVKGLINKCFNVRSYIVTIRGINMNPSIPQCKNCWKWNHITFSCRIQEAICIKYNGSHKYKHHQRFAWCCKANSKINLLGWKPSKVNHTPTPSNVLTAKVIIRWTLTSVLFGNIGSIINDILKSIKSFMTTGSNWFI